MFVAATKALAALAANVNADCAAHTISNSASCSLSLCAPFAWIAFKEAQTALLRSRPSLSICPSLAALALRLTLFCQLEKKDIVYHRLPACSPASYALPNACVNQPRCSACFIFNVQFLIPCARVSIVVGIFSSKKTISIIFQFVKAKDIEFPISK